MRGSVVGVIFHLAFVADWDAAQAPGEYTVSTRGASLADVGFIHCSTDAQWRGVRERFYADVPAEDLVLLSIDPTGLDVRYEPPAPGAGSGASGPNGPGVGSGASGPNGPGVGSGASGPNGPGVEELFPHVYGPIPVPSVLAAEPLPG